LFRNRNFIWTSNFWSKIEILFDDRIFRQKSTILSKILILIRNRNTAQIETQHKFSQIKFFLTKTQMFGQKSIFFRHQHTFLKYSFFSLKLEFLVKTRFFLSKTQIFTNQVFLTKARIFGQNRFFSQKQKF